jgi:hypothetical protein
MSRLYLFKLLRGMSEIVEIKDLGFTKYVHILD